MSKTIKGKVFFEDGVFRNAGITIAGNAIYSIDIIENNQMNEMELGTYIVPGFIDIHSHGCIGYDTCEASPLEIYEMAEFQKTIGVTSYFPTTMTYDEDKLTNVCKNVASSEHPNIKGIYLEGPFISKEKKGAQNEKYIQKANPDMVRRLKEASNGLVRAVAIAPECDGAMEAIKDLKQDVKITLAHTNSSYDVAKEAFENGATQVTHLYNAMPPYNHRNPGVIGATFDHPTAFGELICDGIHVHEAVIRNTFKQLGTNRVILISDSMEATGMPNGDYALDGQAVHVENRRATLEDGTIAGSASTLMDCFRYAISIGIEAKDALLAVTRNPAVAMDIYDSVGSISVGKRADLLLMDNSFNLKQVIQRECDV